MQQLHRYDPTQVGPVRELFALSGMGDLKHILIPAVDELNGTFSVTNEHFLDYLEGAVMGIGEGQDWKQPAAGVAVNLS